MSRFWLFVILLVTLLGVGTAPHAVKAQDDSDFGLDLDGYCQSLDYEYADTIDSNAYGWRCIDRNGNTHEMDLNQACDDQYGGSFHAEYQDFQDPYSWHCVSADPYEPQFDKIWCRVEVNARTIGNRELHLYIVEWRGVDLTDQVMDREVSLYFQGQLVKTSWRGYARGANQWQLSAEWVRDHTPGWDFDSDWYLDYLWHGQFCPAS